jgi:hypothetical protein
MIINSAAVVEDVAEPVPQPEGRGTEVGEAKPQSSMSSDRSGRFEEPCHLRSPWLPHPLVFASPVLPPLLWMGKSGNLKKRIHNLCSNRQNGAAIAVSLSCAFPQLNTRSVRMREVAWQANAALQLGTACGTMGSTSLFSGDFFSSMRTARYCFKSLLPGSTAQILTASCAPMRDEGVAPCNCLPHG